MRGAHLILLCVDTFEVDTVAFVDNMKRRFQNKQIFAVTCDLRSLRSVNTFLWNWQKTSKPRRLDGIICCATNSNRRQVSKGLSFAQDIRNVNYTLQRHLVHGLLSTVLSQPSRRDVRIVITTSSVCEEWPSRCHPFCAPLLSYLPKALSRAVRSYSQLCFWVLFFKCQLVFGVYGRILQRQLNGEKRSDGSPSNIIVSMVDPGLIRSKALRELCFEKNKFRPPSKLKQLRFQMITRSCYVGAQSIIYALFSLKLKAENGGSYIRNCKRMKTLPRVYILGDIQRDYEYRPYVCLNTSDFIHIPNFED